MPIVEKSTYTHPTLFRNGHLQTIFPYFFRKIDNLKIKRQRLTMPDSDFIDLDLSTVQSKSVVILSHGLEGSSKAQYILGMIRMFNQQGHDVMAWNMRGCSGEVNRLKRFYHAGSIEDLEFVINQAIKYGYKKISLIGFSLGGSLTAFYLGRHGKNLPPEIVSASLFSVPCDLESSAMKISKPRYRVYLQNFLTSMRQKIIEKNKIMNLGIDITKIDKIRTFHDFDDHFTAPLHGFKSAHHYYDTNHCQPWLSKIEVPTLIVNAINDPFLTKSCFPIKEARCNKNLFLETPSTGGHVGFVTFNQDQHYWSEKRAYSFIKELM